MNKEKSNGKTDRVTIKSELSRFQSCTRKEGWWIGVYIGKRITETETIIIYRQNQTRFMVLFYGV